MEKISYNKIVMLCGCCILPFFVQSFGLILDYKIHVMIFIIQLIFLLCNIFIYKTLKNLIHICISICTNIVMGVLGFYKLGLTPATISMLKACISIIGLTNMAVFIYRNIWRKWKNKKKNNSKCLDDKCNHDHK